MEFNYKLMKNLHFVIKVIVMTTRTMKHTSIWMKDMKLLKWWTLEFKSLLGNGNTPFAHCNDNHSSNINTCFHCKLITCQFIQPCWWWIRAHISYWLHCVSLAKGEIWPYIILRKKGRPTPTNIMDGVWIETLSYN